MIHRGKKNISINSAMSDKDSRIQTKWHIPEIQPPSKKKKSGDYNGNWGKVTWKRLPYVGFNGQAPFPLFLAAISFCLKVAKS